MHSFRGLGLIVYFFISQWPGYAPWKKIFVKKNNIKALSLSQLAFQMKQILKNFIADVSDFFRYRDVWELTLDQHQKDGPIPSTWDIHKNGITTDNILLVGLVHVLDHYENPSTWMPILKLVDSP